VAYACLGRPGSLRFDSKEKQGWFVPSGISLPNRTVAQVQKSCPLHEPQAVTLGDPAANAEGEADEESVPEAGGSLPGLAVAGDAVRRQKVNFPGLQIGFHPSGTRPGGRMRRGGEMAPRSRVVSTLRTPDQAPRIVTGSENIKDLVGFVSGTLGERKGARAPAVDAQDLAECELLGDVPHLLRAGGPSGLEGVRRGPPPRPARGQ